MRKGILLFVLVVFGCKSQEQQPRQIDFLWKDWRTAEQHSYAQESKTKPFTLVQKGKEEKSHPYLLQQQPGKIVFYRQIGRDAALSVSTYSNKSAPPKARIIVESDFPGPRRLEHLLEAGKENRIPLNSFHGRIARITLDGQDQGLTWVNPVITQVPDVAAEQPDEFLEAFRARHSRDNVLIFLFDAASASHFSCYGYPKKTTPVIDSIASRGVLWTNAFAQATYTIASTGSLFTGSYPSVFSAMYEKGILQDHFKTMAEAFREGGYATALFTANVNASPVFGYGQGFDLINTLYANRKPAREVFADEFIEPVNGWLDSVRDRRFFGYIHFREPHDPYRPPPEYIRRFGGDPDFQGRYKNFNEILVAPQEDRRKIIAAYDGGLNFADEQLSKILNHLKKLNLERNTIIVILSDHGEAFWEHGNFDHYYTLYDEVIRIPFILQFPGEERLKGIRKDELVGTIDLFPTFCSLFGFSRKNLYFDGKSLLPFLSDQIVPQNRFLLTRTDKQAYSIRSQRFKLIDYTADDSREDELFLLPVDPLEKKNLAKAYPVVASFYREQIRKELHRISEFRATLPQKEREAVIDKLTEEQLRALGYIQ